MSWCKGVGTRKVSSINLVTGFYQYLRGKSTVLLLGVYTVYIVLCIVAILSAGHNWCCKFSDHKHKLSVSG